MSPDAPRSPEFDAQDGPNGSPAPSPAPLPAVVESGPEASAGLPAHLENPADRARPLPLADRIVCNLVKQPLASWLLFLQGELDLSALESGNFDAVVGDDGQLVAALRQRGIRLTQAPQFEVTYLGFNFTDPVLGRNADLRRAISLAYNLP